MMDNTDFYLCSVNITLASVLTLVCFQGRGHGDYDSDFSDEENGEKSVPKTKR